MSSSSTTTTINDIPD
ncbi:hypothetical protein Tco_1357576, partial [Tanacetum coccineum]